MLIEGFAGISTPGVPQFGLLAIDAAPQVPDGLWAIQDASLAPDIKGRRRTGIGWLIILWSLCFGLGACREARDPAMLSKDQPVLDGARDSV